MQSLTGKAFESVKHMIDDSAWMEPSSNGEKLLELLSKPEYYGREELEALYLAMNKLFYSDLRKEDDDLAAFRSRFDQAVRKIRKHQVELPQEALGFLFLKQSRVSGESLERLITLTDGDLRLDSVVDGLRRLKMRLFEGDDSHANSKKKNVWLQDQLSEDPWEQPQPGEAPVEETEELDMLEEALQELEVDDDLGKEVTEEHAKDILMTMIKQRIHRPMSLNYKQVQQQKKEVRNARGFKPVTGNATGGGYTMRRDLQQLKSVTKCKACGQVGHWHRECPTKQRTTPSSSTATSAPGSTSHGWWSLAEEVDESEASWKNSMDQE